MDREHAADLLGRPAPLRYRLEYHALRLWQRLFAIPKAPFGPVLIGSMAHQVGVTKKELYAAVNGAVPNGWPD